jgi:hypothetical protein
MSSLARTKQPRHVSVLPGQRSAQRSAISNGSKLFPGVDHRLPWVRRAKDIINDLTSDKDFDQVTAAEASLIRRAAVISVELEALECVFALAGRASERDLDLYTRTTNTLRRVLESIGLERRAKDITPPTLADIAREIDAERAEQERADQEGVAS